MTVFNGGFEEKTFYKPSINMTDFWNGIWKTAFSSKMKDCSNFPDYPPLKKQKYWMYKCSPQFKINVTGLQTPYRFQQMNIDIKLKKSIVSSLIIDFLGYFSIAYCDYDGLLK